MTNFAEHPDLDLEIADRPQNNPISGASWWQRQSIRFKTTVLAIAIGTIPTLAVGSVAYYFAANSLIRETISLRKTVVGDLQNQVNVFMGDRLKDVRVIANLDIFSDPQLSQQATTAQKSAALQQIQNTYGFYNSIAIFDLQGRVIAQTQGKALGNHLNRSYIQAALKADAAIISQPSISTSSGIFSVYTAAPVKNKSTGETIGFVRARIPVEVLSQLLQNYTNEGSQYYLIDNQGQIFLGSAGEYTIETRSDGSTVADKSSDYKAVTAQSIFPDADSLNGQTSTSGVATNIQTNVKQLLTYAPAKPVVGLPSLNWQAILATDTALVYAPQRRLRLVFIFGSALVAVGVGAIAYALTNRLIRPILKAAMAVQEIGRGNFATRLEIPGADEVARLGSDINRMATQLADFVRVQTILTQQSESLKDIAFQLANVENERAIFDTVVQVSFQTLKVERAVYYLFDGDSATVVAESVASEGAVIQASQLNDDLIAEYQAGAGSMRVEAIANLDRADLTPAKQQYLQSIGVKSCLIAPVMVENRLNGLLMVDKSSMPFPWLDEEVEFLAQVASQTSFAITRLKLSEQQQQSQIRETSAKEAMQISALNLLQEVYDVSAGDLTIRARVTDDEIGTIADSYNSTIESLQNLVNQTKVAAMEVQLNTSTNDLAVQSLASETVAQAEAIANTLGRVREMETSIGLVADRADRAEEFVRQATTTIAREDRAMNRTVAEIKAVQHTVIQTATKAEKLGESSQEISQAVNLIGRFAAQTHLLALKASIEAARAGEEGKGFAVIADEVRSLATQSAEATAEIETLVSKIQLETGEVVQAMHQGAAQIASGNELVQQTQQSLGQINQVSQEISQLVSSITQATQQQSLTSAQVGQTIVDVAAIAEHNSQSATQVSSSIRELSAIASKLQSNISKFTT